MTNWVRFGNLKSRTRNSNRLGVDAPGFGISWDFFPKKTAGFGPTVYIDGTSRNETFNIQVWCTFLLENDHSNPLDTGTLVPSAVFISCLYFDNLLSGGIFLASVLKDGFH